MKSSIILGFLFSLLVSFPAVANDWPSQPHLQVTGEGQVTLDADRVDIHASFASQHQDSRLALQELESTLGNLLRTLRRQLPEEARLEAGQISVHPRREQRNDRWEVVGYTAQRDLKILDLPVAKTGEWVEKISQGQPERLGPLNYHSTQASNQQNPALEKAVKDARMKAEVLATTLGQSLGKALKIEEISGPSMQPRMALMAADSHKDTTPEMQPGQVKTAARVMIIFELND